MGPYPINQALSRGGGWLRGRDVGEMSSETVNETTIINPKR